MIYIAIISAIILLIVYLNAPERIEVGAGTPKNWVSKRRRSLIPSLMLSSDGTKLSLRRKVIAVVNGPSVGHLGIEDGCTVIADKLSKKTRTALRENDLVIIKSKSVSGDNPFRLRQIEKIEGEIVSFRNPPSSEYKELRNRPLSTVYANVTHIQKAA